MENGYLLLPAGYRSFHAGDPITAQAIFVQAAAFGERFGDKDLVTLGLQGQGRALIRQGEIARGVALLDEAMVAVTAGEVSPLSAGGVYCSVLEALRRDLRSAAGAGVDVGAGDAGARRSRTWFPTAAIAWCGARSFCNCTAPGRMRWSGRSGRWSGSPVPHRSRGVGAAFYQVGEIQRLRGKFAEAEEAYRQAGQWHRSQGPGLAQLRLAQGRVDAANAAIRRMAEEVQRNRAPRQGSGCLRRDRSRRRGCRGGARRRR